MTKENHQGRSDSRAPDSFKIVRKRRKRRDEEETVVRANAYVTVAGGVNAGTVTGRFTTTEPNVKEIPKVVQVVRAAPDAYCPGCGELSSWAPELCPECLAVNNE